MDIGSCEIVGAWGRSFDFAIRKRNENHIFTVSGNFARQTRFWTKR